MITPELRAYKREWIRKRRLQNGLNRICNYCNKRQMTPGHKTCERCREKMRMYWVAHPRKRAKS